MSTILFSKKFIEKSRLSSENSGGPAFRMKGPAFRMKVLILVSISDLEKIFTGQKMKET